RFCKAIKGDHLPFSSDNPLLPQVAFDKSNIVQSKLFDKREVVLPRRAQEMGAGNICNTLTDSDKPSLRADVDGFYVRSYVLNHLKEDIYPDIVAPDKH